MSTAVGLVLPIDTASHEEEASVTPSPTTMAASEDETAASSDEPTSSMLKNQTTIQQGTISSAEATGTTPRPPSTSSSATTTTTTSNGNHSVSSSHYHSPGVEDNAANGAKRESELLQDRNQKNAGVLQEVSQEEEEEDHESPALFAPEEDNTARSGEALMDDGMNTAMETTTAPAPAAGEPAPNTNGTMAAATGQPRNENHGEETTDDLPAAATQSSEVEENVAVEETTGPADEPLGSETMEIERNDNDDTAGKVVVDNVADTTEMPAEQGAVKNLMADDENMEPALNETADETMEVSTEAPPVGDHSEAGTQEETVESPRKPAAVTKRQPEPSEVIDLLDSESEDDNTAELLNQAAKKPRLAENGSATAPTAAAATAAFASYQSRDANLPNWMAQLAPPQQPIVATNYAAAMPMHHPLYAPPARTEPPKQPQPTAPEFRRDRVFSQPIYMAFPLGFKPTWKHLTPPPVPGPSQPQPQRQQQAQHAGPKIYQLSLLNVNEFTIEGLSSGYGMPATSIAGLRVPIRQVSRKYGKSVYERDKEGGGGKWRIPLGAYHDFAGFLRSDRHTRVYGIPPNQLQIASLERARQEKGYPEPDKLIEYGVPKGLASALAPFQRGGVDFVKEKNGRALIADDMGLGAYYSLIFYEIMSLMMTTIETITKKLRGSDDHGDLSYSLPACLPFFCILNVVDHEHTNR